MVKHICLTVLTLVVLFFAAPVEVLASSFVEVKLAAGQTVSEVVFAAGHDCNYWQNDAVVVLHKNSDEVYGKDNVSMSRLPIGTRVRIIEEMQEPEVVTVASSSADANVPVGSVGTALPTHIHPVSVLPGAGSADARFSSAAAVVTASVVPVSPASMPFFVILILSSMPFNLILALILWRNKRRRHRYAVSPVVLAPTREWSVFNIDSRSSPPLAAHLALAVVETDDATRLREFLYVLDQEFPPSVELCPLP